LEKKIVLEKKNSIQMFHFLLADHLAEGQLTFRYSAASVVVRLSTFHENIFSRTNEPILTKKASVGLVYSD